MMKIITLTMVKNEADIIETFVRYNINIAYKMYFIDNGCTDRTIEILKKLQSEGMPIEIINASYVAYEQVALENKYMREIVTDNEFDVFIPLDADEFIGANSVNVLKMLETVDLDKITLVKWKTYVLMDKKCRKECIFDRITHVRARENNTFTKVIIPAKFIEENNLIMTMGHHDVEKCEIEKVERDDIYIAHFPVRSEEQIRQKICQGIIAQLSSSYHNVVAFHWVDMYNKLKNGEFDVIDYSKNYALFQSVCSDEDIKYEPFDYSWCMETMSLKYSENSDVTQIDIINNLFITSQIMCINQIINAHGSTYNSEKENILMYGAGAGAVSLLKNVNFQYINIVAFVDSDIKKEFEYIDNYLILSPDKIKFLKYDKILITSDKCFDEIREKLHQLGIDDDIIADRFYLTEVNINNI